MINNFRGNDFFYLSIFTFNNTDFSPIVIVIRIFKNKEDKLRFKEKFCFISKKRGEEN